MDPITLALIGTAALVGGSALSFFGTKKYKAPARASGEVFGYSADGQLVSKGGYKYNPVTGVYELSAGTLTPAEKQERSKILAAMTDLISRVGETPASFTNYANEVAKAYQDKGQKYLDEQYDNYQTKLNESLAERGLSSSRASVDLGAALLKDKSRAETELYDQSQMTANNILSTLRSQDQSALSLLSNVQNSNTQADQNWLSLALQAQQQGQQYENQKAGVANQNTAMRNSAVQSLGNNISSLGGVLLGGAGLNSIKSAGGAAAATSAGASSAVSLSPSYTGTSGGIAYDLPNYNNGIYSYMPNYGGSSGGYGGLNISDLLK